MAFTKLSIEATGAPSAAGAHSPSDIWAIFRALRDARSVFGLRPGHLQTLQAMLSFLKPGHGETVFASNDSICQRVGGIDERTLRRHISRFVELGFIQRQDSSNRKRYRVRSSGGAAISYGLSLAPLLQRAGELMAIAQELENARRDRIFLRKQVLAKLAVLEEHGAAMDFVSQTRKALRRKLGVIAYRALLADAEALCAEFLTEDHSPEPVDLSANDGQTVRHHSKSKQERKELDSTSAPEPMEPERLVAVCDQATSFAAARLRTWDDIERHARSLAPMMGIAPDVFEKTKRMIGAQKASAAIFIVLQFGSRIKDLAAYFHSVTLGNRRDQFDPCALLKRLSKQARTV